MNAHAVYAVNAVIFHPLLRAHALRYGKIRDCLYKGVADQCIHCIQCSRLERAAPTPAPRVGGRALTSLACVVSSARIRSPLAHFRKSLSRLAFTPDSPPERAQICTLFAVRPSELTMEAA